MAKQYAMVIAAGAIVPPPESTVPEIVIPPEANARDIPLPKNYLDAVTGPYCRYWSEAIATELSNLLDRGTWREEELPPGKKPIPGRYVYKVKPDILGLIAKFRARWIMKGFLQKKGLDYDKTFASVANIVSLRILFAITAELDWELQQMDVRAAYLCAKVEKHLKIYIQPPDGYKCDRGI